MHEETTIFADKITIFTNAAELRERMGDANYNIVTGILSRELTAELTAEGTLVFHDGLPVLRCHKSDSDYAIDNKLCRNAMFRQALMSSQPDFAPCLKVEITRAMMLSPGIAVNSSVEQITLIRGFVSRK